MSLAEDTIVAVATAPGRSGVGVVRLSGPQAFAIGERICGRAVEPGRHPLRRFRDARGELLDEGLVLAFRGPASYTGEDTIELHGHGSPVVLDALVASSVEAGARLAAPGEFSRRAFMNDRMDLAQAEAVADLIDAGTRKAARAAMRSLTGEFSSRIHDLVEAVTRMRIMMEAAIDFPEEEIDFLSEPQYVEGIEDLAARVATLAQSARTGVLLASGVNVVLAGRPNAGKSSLMNTLAGEDRAIVSAIPGTTRDTVEVAITLNGLPVTLIDTAGLREATDVIESEGVRRAHRALDRADLVLHVVDSSEAEMEEDAGFSVDMPTLTVMNKSDLAGRDPGRSAVDTVAVSAMTGAGIDSLIEAIQELAGYAPAEEDTIVARRRHVDAIRAAAGHIDVARDRLLVDRAGELAAEELRLAQNALGAITGEVTSDDLLGRIFASFCIGK